RRPRDAQRPAGPEHSTYRWEAGDGHRLGGAVAGAGQMVGRRSGPPVSAGHRGAGRRGGGSVAAGRGSGRVAGRRRVRVGRRGRMWVVQLPSSGLRESRWLRSEPAWAFSSGSWRVLIRLTTVTIASTTTITPRLTGVLICGTERLRSS